MAIPHELREKFRRHFTDDQLEKMALLPVRARLADGRVEDDTVRATLNAVIEEAVRRANSDSREAAVSPIGSNQKPRMLQITAWIAHAGKPNRNGDAFLAEDLREAVENGLFVPPFMGMVDFNHDFETYGAWYKAEYQFDPKAGEWGILAEGAIFAWRYEALADRLLAMQQRQGFIDVSMACIPESYERGETEDGRRYMILRKPVFFTTSVLDVDPADPNARGLGTEDPGQSPESRKQQLTQAGAILARLSEEDSMDELIKALRDVLKEAAEEHREALSALVEAAQKLPKVEADLAEAQARVAELEAEVAALNTKLTEAGVAADAARAEIESVNAALEAERAKVAELEAFKAEREAADAAAEREARKAARLAELPEAARAALEKLTAEEREALEKRWVEASEEEWKVIKAAMDFGGRSSYADRSEREGVLPGAAEVDEGEWAITKVRRK